MADKTIGQLVAAPSNLTEYTGQELFVLEQNNTAKKLTMQILENWLVSFADGHGGIHTIEKTGTSGFVDTYTITFADRSTATFTVTNGNGITGVTQYWAVSSSNTTVPSRWSTTRQTMTTTNKYLWSYMTFQRDSGSFSTTKSVVGVYGDTGQAWYVWIKYAGVQPTSDADMGDTPDNWIGIYSGISATAPTHYTDYIWYEIKGKKGDTGDPSTIVTQSITYLEGNSGTVVPTGSWTETIPTVTPGNFLWTRTKLTFNDGTQTTAYSVSRYGIDGTGSVSTVNSLSPDTNGNVALLAENIPASDNQSVQTHLDNVEDAADNVAESLATYVRPNLLDNWYFVGGGSQLGYGKFPINQRGQTTYSGSGYCVDRWGSMYSDSHTVELLASGMKVTKGSTGSWPLWQLVKSPTSIAGKTVTFSVLYKDATNGFTLVLNSYDGSTYASANSDSAVSGGIGLLSVTTTLREADKAVRTVFRLTSGSATIIAAKLEVGSTQTLAHQENGAWVLNEVPDYAEELGKCQKYLYPLTAWHSMFCGRVEADKYKFFIPHQMAGNPNAMTLNMRYMFPTQATDNTGEYTFVADPGGIYALGPYNGSLPAFTMCIAMPTADAFLSCETT